MWPKEAHIPAQPQLLNGILLICQFAEGPLLTHAP